MEGSADPEAVIALFRMNDDCAKARDQQRTVRQGEVVGGRLDPSDATDDCVTPQGKDLS